SQVTLKAADRDAPEERVVAYMDGLAPRLERRAFRNPRDVGLQNEDRIRLAHQWTRIESKMHGMVGGERQIARPVLHHGDRETLGKGGKLAESFEVAPAIARHDQRPLRPGQYVCRFRNA